MIKIFKAHSLTMLFAFAGMAVFLISFYGYTLVHFFMEISEHNTKQRLIETSKRLATLTTAEELAAYRETADMERPDSHPLRRKLADFAGDADVLSAYCLLVENGKLQYIVGTGNDENARARFATLPEDLTRRPEVMPALGGRSGASELGLSMPGWEGLITGYAPVFDREGKVLASCWVDVSGENITNARRKVIILRNMEVAAFVILVACGIFGFVKYRREAVAAKRASVAKSLFLSRMSHEIRAPMNIIIGMSELALRDYEKPQGREYIAGIKQAGADLLAIINDILDLSKAEFSSLEIRNAPYGAASLFNDMIAITKVNLRGKYVRFSADIAPDIPGVITGDETRVKQILLNLLSNAIKYTEQGCICFTARCQREKGDSIALTFSVSDSGIGIRHEDMDRLFTEFARIGGNHSTVEGTGLGLPITRLLCNALGGDIQVESEFGRGSTFTATIRQSAAEDAPPMGLLEVTSALPPQTEAACFSAPDFRVLIVDDIATNLKVAEGLLAPYNMRTDVCLSGQEAVALVQEYDYDLVLMDHMMPGMDGMETVAAIRSLGGPFETLPITALTANAMSGMREMFLENGFNDFLSKPIEIPKLEKLLEKWVPAERRRDPASATTEKVLPEAPESRFAGIVGLDAVKGMAAAGGTSAAYRDVLRLYCRDANGRIEFLRLPCAATKLNIFITHVHALKSASAGIGARALSEEAGSLEAAGNRGDMEFIREHVDGFRSRLAYMLERIDAAFAVDKERAPGAEDGKAGITPTRAVLAPKLLRLKKALEMEEVRTADRLLAELAVMQLDDESGVALTHVSDMILISEFGEAVIILDSILPKPS